MVSVCAFDSDAGVFMPCLSANLSLRLFANMVGICFAIMTNRICGLVCVFVCTRVRSD